MICYAATHNTYRSSFIITGDHSTVRDSAPCNVGQFCNRHGMSDNSAFSYGSHNSTVSVNLGSAVGYWDLNSGSITCQLDDFVPAM